MSRYFPSLSLPRGVSLRRLLSDSLSRYPPRRAAPDQRAPAAARIGPAGLGPERELVAARSASCQSALSSFAGSLPSSPRIGLALSGGGYRALVGGLGSLRGLNRLGLIDSSLYLSALSGSSWLLALLFQQLSLSPDRSVDYSALTATVKHRLAQPLFSTSISAESAQAYIAEKLHLYLNANPNNPDASAFTLSLIDLFSWALNERILKQQNSNDPAADPTPCLSHQRRAVEGGHFPYPIYTAINDQSIQFEFSPHEIGSGELNYWIPTWAFGKKWDTGVSIASDIPEPPLALLLAVFGSAHCVSADRILEEIAYASPATGQLISRLRPLAFQQLKLGTTRPFSPQPFPNPMYRYGSTPLSQDAQLNLLDAGTAFNVPFTPLLQPQRELDILLVFDYSSPPEAFTGVWMKLAADYARFHSLPFPDLNRSVQFGHQEQTRNMSIPPSKRESAQTGFSPVNSQSSSSSSSSSSGSIPIPFAVTPEQSNLQRAMQNSISVFPGSVSHNIPTIIYFPLLKHPAFDRQFDPRENFLQGGYCSTLNFKYNSEQIDQLAGLTEFTVLEARHALKQIIRKVAEEKDRVAQYRGDKNKQ